MRKGIIGNAEDKFTEESEILAKSLIALLLTSDDVLVSGGCHLGGVDIWAEERADEICIDKIVHKPRKLKWDGGYRERNLKIAEDSEIIHVILVDNYPPDYVGRQFEICYHCMTDSHIKSGACWTAWKAIRLHGKPAIWHIIHQEGSHD